MRLVDQYAVFRDRVTIFCVDIQCFTTDLYVRFLEEMNSMVKDSLVRELVNEKHLMHLEFKVFFLKLVLFSSLAPIVYIIMIVSLHAQYHIGRYILNVYSFYLTAGSKNSAKWAVLMSVKPLVDMKRDASLKYSYN